MEINLERIEKMLALVVLSTMKDAPQGEKAMAMSRVGYQSKEIAALLGTTPAVVSQQLYEQRKGTTRSKRKTKTKKPGV